MTTTNHVQETDPSGLQTLENLSNATRFNRWMFDTIQPYCKGHVLEVGSGIGNMSQYFLEKNFRLTVSDLRSEYLDMLQNKFGNNPNLAGVRSIDLVDTNFENLFHDLLGQFDTIVALNVVEHIEDDAQAISNCKKLLKPGGHLVVLVPAYQWLYNQFDEELGHFVRYRAGSLKKLLQSQQMEVVRVRYFNMVGIAGWLVNGKFFRKKIIPRGQLKIYDKMVPLIKLADAITFHSVGLSVLSLSRKPLKN